MINAEIKKILDDHPPKSNHSADLDGSNRRKGVSISKSEIPNIFFDQILVDYKLSRIEIMVLMYLYRQVWCRPNLYKQYGISQLFSHGEMSKEMKIPLEDIHHALISLEDYSFIVTIRSGQYFVRKFFTKENDKMFAQTYDDFEE